MGSTQQLQPPSALTPPVFLCTKPQHPRSHAAISLYSAHLARISMRRVLRSFRSNWIFTEDANAALQNVGLGVAQVEMILLYPPCPRVLD